MSLREIVAAERASLVTGTRLFDVHSHTGADVDGMSLSSAARIVELEALDARSAIFPFHVTDGYDAENRRVLEEARRAPDRLVAFARLDPRLEGAGQEAAAALAAGARGVKLHPRAEAFTLDHPGVDAVVAAAAEARAPVLIHAGVGIEPFGPTVLALAARHPACPLILAHAAISDLDWIWEEVPAHPNLLFDTAWLGPADLLALFARLPPGRILFGSDAPYIDAGTCLAATLRCARFAGLSPGEIGLVAGGQLENLLAGNAPLEAGPAPGRPPAPLGFEASRALGALAALLGVFLGGGDPTRVAQLARFAVGDGARLGEEGEEIAALLDEALAGGEAGPWPVAMALTLICTPGAEPAKLA